MTKPQVTKFTNDVLTYLVSLPPDNTDPTEGIEMEPQTDKTVEITIDESLMFTLGNEPMTAEMYDLLTNLFDKYPEANVWYESEIKPYRPIDAIENDAKANKLVANGKDRLQYQRIIEIANYARQNYPDVLYYSDDELRDHIAAYQGLPFTNEDIESGATLYLSIGDVTGGLMDLVRHLLRDNNYLDVDKPDDD